MHVWLYLRLASDLLLSVWCAIPFHCIPFNSIQFGVSVLLAQHLTTLSFSHKCQMIKYLHLKYIAFDFILRTLCGFLRLSNIRQTSFDLAIKRIIYHFWKLFFFKTNKLKSLTFDRLTSLHYLWIQMRILTKSSQPAKLLKFLEYFFLMAFAHWELDNVIPFLKRI